MHGPIAYLASWSTTVRSVRARHRGPLAHLGSEARTDQIVVVSAESKGKPYDACARCMLARGKTRIQAPTQAACGGDWWGQHHGVDPC